MDTVGVLQTAEIAQLDASAPGQPASARRVDIEGFGWRTDPMQVAVRQGLWSALNVAFDDGGHPVGQLRH